MDNMFLDPGRLLPYNRNRPMTQSSYRRAEKPQVRPSAGKLDVMRFVALPENEQQFRDVELLVRGQRAGPPSCGQCLKPFKAGDVIIEVGNKQGAIAYIFIFLSARRNK